MSTTAVLISDEKKIYDRLFGKYVKIPTFSNKFEARELCIKLLKDKEWRDDLVKGSNEAIQNGEFRFHHMIKKLESISGILLTPDTEGAFDFINPKNVMNHLSLNLLVESNVLFLFQCSATLLPNSIVERIANIAKTNPLRKHIPNVIIEHYKKHFKEYD
jgi:ABC-type iron transport system FetAB ATPase subunit